MKGNEKAQKALCMLIATLPWAILGVFMAVFGIIRTLGAVFMAFAVIVITIALILFIRACGLELYERIFEQRKQR